MANNKADIQPGFSPKPTTLTDEGSGASSEDPITHSPKGEMDGPVIQSAQAPKVEGGATTKDQIVRFKK